VYSCVAAADGSGEPLLQRFIVPQRGFQLRHPRRRQRFIEKAIKFRVGERHRLNI
jgi:hypothetical protein